MNMRTVICTVFFLSLFIPACHRKTVPVISERTSFPEAPAPARPVISQGGPEMIAAGKTIYDGKCNRCHDLKSTDAYTADSWKPILKRMIPMAKLNDDEAKQVSAYVLFHSKK